ncbi:MAG TPA: TIGR03435 family protein, partial [Bryobacteraceae bacterium]|nr:TIGR03435 family protein [Bryobacteraceae bacterium]
NTANGLRIAGTLRMFVKYAYDLEDPQLSGGPAWLDRDIYAINARANRRVAAGELKQMLQSLLTDRFRLTVHRETRELPVYLLVLAKSGSKLDRGDENLRAVSSGPTLLRGTMDSARIARQLTLMLHRTVIDKTGLQGVWKFDLTWAPDDVTTGPSLFTAIQEQLGLKLESGKGPVQVLVIDRAEKPSDN